MSSSTTSSSSVPSSSVSSSSVPSSTPFSPPSLSSLLPWHFPDYTHCTQNGIVCNNGQIQVTKYCDCQAQKILNNQDIKFVSTIIGGNTYNCIYTESAEPANMFGCALFKQPIKGPILVYSPDHGLESVEVQQLMEFYNRNK